jgi:hypothetical protein
VELCNGSAAQVAGWDLAYDDTAAKKQNSVAAARPPVVRSRTVPEPPPAPAPAEQEQSPKKRGLFGRLLDIFK